jgi:hypothetical protein
MSYRGRYRSRSRSRSPKRYKSRYSHSRSRSYSPRGKYYGYSDRRKEFYRSHSRSPMSSRRRHVGSRVSLNNFENYGFVEVYITNISLICFHFRTIPSQVVAWEYLDWVFTLQNSSYIILCQNMDLLKECRLLLMLRWVICLMNWAVCLADMGEGGCSVLGECSSGKTLQQFVLSDGKRILGRILHHDDGCEQGDLICITENNACPW